MKKKLLSINIFYHPRSFGGATIVAEQINRLMVQDGDYDVFVITSLPISANLEPYQIIRYEHNQITIFGIGMPLEMSDYYNQRMSEIIEWLVKNIQPDFAHIHSIQGFGAGAVLACKAANVKTAITLHDGWWLTDKQFIFANEVISEPSNRNLLLQNILKQADLLLAPSLFAGNVYKNSLGVTTFLNKNGVLPPLNTRNRTTPTPPPAKS